MPKNRLRQFDSGIRFGQDRYVKVMSSSTVLDVQVPHIKVSSFGDSAATASSF